MTTTMGMGLALGCLVVGTVAFGFLFRKAALMGFEDPEERLQDLDGGRAQWWEVAMAWVVVAGLMAWDSVALWWSGLRLRRNRRSPISDHGRVAKPERTKTPGTMGGRVAGSGFTLVEMLCVIAILGVLVATTVPAVWRAYRGATARAAWVVHCTQARHAGVDNIEKPANTAKFVEMTTEQAFRRFYPQYSSYADVPRETVRYWRGERERTSAVDDGN